MSAMQQPKTRPRRICDGCNVRAPWEHRCHGNRMRVGGEAVEGSCECEECSCTWSDADYAELIKTSKELEGTVDLPAIPHKRCPDCGKPVATVEDESNHDTGACGCRASRSLCWRAWNNNVCVPESPYAPDPKPPV